MAAFRKGHVKVVKWMVKHVSQFPSDTELQRYIATVNDKVGNYRQLGNHNNVSYHAIMSKWSRASYLYEEAKRPQSFR